MATKLLNSTQAEEVIRHYNIMVANGICKEKAKLALEEIHYCSKAVIDACIYKKY